MADILVNTFKYILRNYGHNCLLQRRINYATDPLSGIYAVPGGSEKGDYSSTLEKWACYSTFAGRKMNLASVQEEHPEGWVHTLKMIFYFQSEAKPNEGDRIYEPDDRMPAQVFIIEYARPVRGHKGAIVYYEVGTVRSNPQ